MALTDLLGSVLRSTALGLAMYISSCGGPPPSMGCQRDTDCYAPRVCVQGYCEDRNGGGEGESEGNSPEPNGTSGGNPDNLLSNLTGKIVFISVRDTHNEDNYEIYVIDANGDNLRRLTNNSAQDAAPRWSPNGRKIIFFSNRDRRESWDIYTMEADGSNQMRLTQDSGNYGNAIHRDPAWSSDGARIAFASYRPNGDDKFAYLSQIYTMNADGSNQRSIDPTPDDNEYYPAWSPDSTKIVFSSGGYYDLYRVDANGGNRQRLTYDGENNRESNFPAWFPGSEIVFSSSRESGRDDIYVMNSDGNDSQRVIWKDTEALRYPCWSPDGTKIAYTVGFGLIHITTADGTEDAALTEGAQPSWTP